MGFLSVLSYAHQLISARLQPGDTAVDATAGTGADTLFLAKTVGRRGSVYSFDIQEEALRLTKERLVKETAPLGQVTLLHESHSLLHDKLPEKLRGSVAAVMFNLGYLPAEGADPGVITRTDSTLAAMEAALTVLRPRGILTAVLYPGHPGGEEEARAVTEWAAELPVERYQSIIYRQLQRPSAPYVVAIEKKAHKL
ncbi:class I SAM-dependent methyltransferase [Paenibacillus sp. P96]|uniref:Class I SAM-dependent methyltransferase n=1 Tax=Paenibacillus zeirhizosphaerae TaxID=2987519 RepID=A0ABT9FL12_9BACL|nr:class I SAM-dependent methyltransferase [Paenibacillus sp. P96]MDP4095416.1 class I SAM-dependent methyltransferase [Paenibacillus sp. P96]